MKKVIIEGMSCEKCVANVEKALEDIKEITSMEVTVGQAVIEGEVSNELLIEAIEDFGFDVIEIK